MHLSLSFGLSHTHTHRRLLTPLLLSSHQDFSHGLWAPLLRAVGPIKWLSRPGPSLPWATGTRLGLPNLFFLLGLPCPLEYARSLEREKGRLTRGLHRAQHCWKVAFLRPICRCLLGRYISWRVCVSQGGAAALWQGPALACFSQ